MQGQSYHRRRNVRHLQVNHRAFPHLYRPAPFSKSTVSVDEMPERRGKRRSFSLTASTAW
jgi:hypothetical protein